MMKKLFFFLSIATIFSCTDQSGEDGKASSKSSVQTWPDREHLAIESYQKIGKIAPSLGESDPVGWPEEITAPEGAPNVLLIMMDDVGFGASSAFGGPIPTSAFDRIANKALR
jgi:arylsulfatase